MVHGFERNIVIILVIIFSFSSSLNVLKGYINTFIVALLTESRSIFLIQDVFIAQVLCWPAGRGWLCSLSQPRVGERHPNQQTAQQRYRALLWFGVPVEAQRTTR